MICGGWTRQRKLLLFDNWNERFDARVAEVEGAPERGAEEDVRDELIADAEVREDGAAEVAGQEDCTEDGGARDEVDRQTSEFEDTEWNRKRDADLHVFESLGETGGLDELHDGAEGEEECGDSGEKAGDPDSHAMTSFARRPRLYGCETISIWILRGGIGGRRIMVFSNADRGGAAC